MPSRSLYVWLVAIATVAAVRALALLVDQDALLFEVGGIDSPHYLELARGFAQGKWPDEQPFFWAPGYPFFLGLLALVSDGALVPKLVQLALGTLSCALIALLAFRLFEERRVALTALLFAGLYGPLVYYELLIAPATLDVLLWLCLLVTLLEADRRKSLLACSLWLVLAGIFAAASAITRGAVLLLLPWAVLWLVLGASQSLRGVLARALSALFLLLPVALVLALVLAHNRHHDLVRARPSGATSAAELSSSWLLSYNAGINFLLGNVPELHAHNRVEDPLCFLQYKLAMAEPVLHGQARPSEQNDFVLERAFRFIREQPLQWLGLLARKTHALVHGEEISRDTSVYGSRTDNEVLALLVWKHGIAFPSGLLIPLALFGLALARNAQDRRAHALLLGALGCQALFVLAFFVTTRYRLPLIASAIPYAAYAAVRAVDLLRGRASLGRSQLVLACAIGLLLLALSNLGLRPMPAQHEPFEHEHLGNLLAQRGLAQQATEHFEKALALDPRYAPSHFQLGRQRLAKGELARAAKHFEAGLRLAPAAYPARLELASVLVKLERPNEAAAQLEQAMSAIPDSPQRRSICLYALTSGLDLGAKCR